MATQDRAFRLVPYRDTSARIATAQAAEQMRKPQTDLGQMPMQMAGQNQAPGMGMPDAGSFMGQGGIV